MNTSGLILLFYGSLITTVGIIVLVATFISDLKKRRLIRRIMKGKE